MRKKGIYLLDQLSKAMITHNRALDSDPMKTNPLIKDLLLFFIAVLFFLALLGVLATSGVNMLMIGAISLVFGLVLILLMPRLLRGKESEK